MRYLVMLLIGLFLGGIGSTMTLSALQARHAQSRALMTLIDMEQRHVQAQAATATCTGPAIAARLHTLRTLAGLIDEAFAEPTDDLFQRYGQRLNAAIESAQANIGKATDCLAAHEHLVRIGDACDACHRDYR